MTRVTAGRRANAFLSAWQFWIGIAYFGLALVVVALIVQFSQVNSAERLAIREQATRIAITTATADAQYRQCLDSIPTLRRVNAFVRGVQTLHATLLANAESTHRATRPGSPTYASQTTNLARLQQSVDLVSGIRFPVPTGASCAARRRVDLGRAGLTAPPS